MVTPSRQSHRVEASLIPPSWKFPLDARTSAPVSASSARTPARLNLRRICCTSAAITFRGWRLPSLMDWEEGRRSGRSDRCSSQPSNIGFFCCDKLALFPCLKGANGELLRVVWEGSFSFQNAVARLRGFTMNRFNASLFKHVCSSSIMMRKRGNCDHCFSRRSRFCQVRLCCGWDTQPKLDSTVLFFLYYLFLWNMSNWIVTLLKSIFLKCFCVDKEDLFLRENLIKLKVPGLRVPIVIVLVGVLLPDSDQGVIWLWFPW